MALVAIMGLLAAQCPAPAPTAAPTQAPQPTPTTPAKPVTINWWHIQSVPGPHQTAWQEMADAYHAAHPNVTINITILENEAFKAKMTTVMQSGNLPDLFQSWGGGVMNEYAKAGLLKDITADVKGEWGDSFGAGALGVYAYKGVQYGVPWDMGVVGFWYNKELFAKAGITTPPKTWTEFLDVVKKLKAAGITPISLGEGDKWPGHFYWVYLAVRIGGKSAFDAAYSRTGSFADPPFVQAGEKLKELIALEPFQKGWQDMKHDDSEAIMGNGQAAMILMGQWAPEVKGVMTCLGWCSAPPIPTDGITQLAGRPRISLACPECQPIRVRPLVSHILRQALNWTLNKAEETRFLTFCQTRYAEIRRHCRPGRRISDEKTGFCSPF